MFLFISSYPKSLFEEKSGCSWWLYSLSPMKCFSKGSVIQSHCAKMREGIYTQAKLHAVHLQKQGRERHSTKYRAKEGHNHSAVGTHEVPDTFRKYIFEMATLPLRRTSKSLIRLNGQDFLSPQLSGVHSTISTDNTVNC